MRDCGWAGDVRGGDGRHELGRVADVASALVPRVDRHYVLGVGREAGEGVLEVGDLVPRKAVPVGGA